MSHPPAAARGNFSFIIGLLALVFSLYAIIVMGSVPYFTIGMVLFIAGSISKIMNTDVIDVFIFSLLGIAAMMFVLFQVDTRFLQRGEHHTPAQKTESSAPQH